jgi:hypothetical protein
MRAKAFRDADGNYWLPLEAVTDLQTQLSALTRENERLRQVNERWERYARKSPDEMAVIAHRNFEAMERIGAERDALRGRVEELEKTAAIAERSIECLRRTRANQCDLRQIVDVVRQEYKASGDWSDWDEGVYQTGVTLLGEVDALLSTLPAPTPGERGEPKCATCGDRGTSYEYVEGMAVAESDCPDCTTTGEGK